MLLFENAPVVDGSTLAVGAGNPFLIWWPRDRGSGDAVCLAALWDVGSQTLHWLKRLRWAGGQPEAKAKTLLPYAPLQRGHTYTFALFCINDGQRVQRVFTKRRQHWGMDLLATLFPLGVTFIENLSFSVT